MLGKTSNLIWPELNATVAWKDSKLRSRIEPLYVLPLSQTRVRSKLDAVTCEGSSVVVNLSFIFPHPSEDRRI